MLVTFVLIFPLQAELVLVVPSLLESVIFMLAMWLALVAEGPSISFWKWMMRLSPGLTMSVGASSPVFVT
jgi:hypothetical protein